MNEAAWGALGLIVVALITGTVTVITTLLTRSSKKEQPVADAPTPPPADADPRVITDYLLEQAVKSHNRIEELKGQMLSFRRLVARLIAPLLAWIDSGHEPPAPSIAPELRDLVNEIDPDHT